MPANDDAELIREGLRAVLRSENSSGKALEAKAAAARQLAKLNGLAVADDDGGDEVGAPDPMRDLDLIERARQLRARGGMTAREWSAWHDRLNRGEPLDALERDLARMERHRPRRRGRRTG